MQKIEQNAIPTEIFVGNILGALTRGISDKMDDAITIATGQSTSACYAIVQIGTEPDSSIEELRRMLALEHSSVVRLIDRLEKHHLVERLRDLGTDRRQVRIRLTVKGEEHFTKILDARSAVLAKVMGQLDDGEKTQLRGLIEKMMPAAVDPGDDQHVICRLCELEVCPQDICPVNHAHEGHVDDVAEGFRRKVDSRFS